VSTSTRAAKPGPANWRRRCLGLGFGLAIVVGEGAVARAQYEGWTILADAAELKNPLPATPDVLRQGEKVFVSRCRPCHGRDGTGFGPRSSPDHPAADLTAAARAGLNPDGVLFYKVWNGRRPMPAFKTELTREDVWAVVEYVKSLRRE